MVVWYCLIVIKYGELEYIEFGIKIKDRIILDGNEIDIYRRF